MTKKGPLGRAEAFYVEGHYKKQTVEEIAKDLDRALSLIRKQIETLEISKPKERIAAGAAMARREGVVVMTEAASALSDNSKGKAKHKPSHCTTRIKND